MTSNSFAGMALGVGLLMAATSVPMVRSGPATIVLPHVRNTIIRKSADDLRGVVEQQRRESRTLLNDANSLAILAEDAGVGTSPPLLSGSVSVRRDLRQPTAGSHPSPETHHVDPQTF
jgi:hypothetical protein